MVAFNPSISSNQGDNYTNRSERSSGNRSLGTLFEAVADTINTVGKQKKASEDKALDNAVSGSVDSLVQSGMEGQSGPRSRSADASNTSAGNSADTPQQIADSGDNIGRWKQAYLQGKMTPVMFETRKAAEAKRLRSLFPGHENEIDGMLNARLGQSTANDLRIAQQKEWDAEAASASDELKHKRSLVEEAAQSGIALDPMFLTTYKRYAGKDFSPDAGQLNEAAYVASQATVMGDKFQTERESASIALKKARGEDVSLDAYKSAGKSVQKLQGDIIYTSLHDDMAKLQTIGDKVAEARTPEEAQAAIQVTNHMFAMANDAFEKQYNAVDAHGNSFASMINDASKKEDLRKQFLGPLQSLKDAYINGDTGVLHGFKLANDARKDYDENVYLKQSGGGQKQLEAVMKKWPSYIEEHMRQKATGEWQALEGKDKALYQAIEMDLLGGTSSEKLLDQLNTTGSLDGASPKVVQLALQDKVKFILNPALPADKVYDASRGLYSEENRNLINKNARQNPLSVFNILVNDGMTQRQKGTKGWDDYVSFAKVQSIPVLRSFSDIMEETQKNTDNGSIHYDEKTQRFVYKDLHVMGTKTLSTLGLTINPFAGLFNDIDYLRAGRGEKATAQFNQYLDTMQPILDGSGTTTETFLSQVFASEKYKGMEKSGNFLTQMQRALQDGLSRVKATDSTEGTGPPPRVAPPPEIKGFDSSSNEPTARSLVGASRGTMAVDEFLKARSDKPMEAIAGLDDKFAGNIASMFQDAPPEIAAGLGIYSARRSTSHQKELWTAAVKRYGSPEAARRWVAPPGHSKHEQGLASDLSWNGRSLREAPAYVVAWVHEHAKEHGLHFPLGNENWHVEPIGSRKKQVASK